MLYQVEMTLKIPDDMHESILADLKAREKSYVEILQRTGKWRHLWRVVGRSQNVSIFDVESNSELHDLLSQLPLYPYLEITIKALCRHPASIAEGDI